MPRSDGDRVAIIGIGIYPHGRHPGVSAATMGIDAIRKALADAGVTWGEIEFAAGGSMVSGMPDSVVGDLGLTGVPFINVRNACATGASTLLAASTALRAGDAELAVVVGYDKHERGAFSAPPELLGVADWYAAQGLMLTPQFFAMKIQRYMHDYGISASTLAKVAAKAYRNGALNPTAFRRTPMSERHIASSAMITPPLTQYMYCSPDEGAVAAVLATERKAAELGVEPIYLRSVALRTRSYGSLEVFGTSVSLADTPPPTTPAAEAAFAQAGLTPTDVDIAQLSDGEAGAEVMGMAETGLCAHGAQEELIQQGQTELDGSLPVNTDGGLIANGEPVGANGLRQVHETVLQLRGQAGQRQVPNDPQVGFTQVYGAPGVAACTVLAKS
ncbi:acetyl-CoA acetyltransferase [Tamaricihabitans halophyticus]|uniref:Acetyl-CoA acetyltransferase n=1 Tax=Tamaricihabitans halophyticus TaxID=1262583 RepID=A0A4R2QY83_9PSEU|nr:thiolase family protein [Tamaricihabitans halophyticus]TCP54139.1 acetyl-CoA acetyltransferase [Tamaricihabitans halophyticus]